MDFVNSVLSGLGVETGAGAYRAVVAENYAYFENVKGIKSYKEDEIVLFLKKGEMSPCGANGSPSKNSVWGTSSSSEKLTLST